MQARAHFFLKFSIDLAKNHFGRDLKIAHCTVERRGKSGPRYVGKDNVIQIAQNDIFSDVIKCAINY